jgi:subtilisin family serine protease
MERTRNILAVAFLLLVLTAAVVQAQPRLPELRPLPVAGVQRAFAVTTPQAAAQALARPVVADTNRDKVDPLLLLMADQLTFGAPVSTDMCATYGEPEDPVVSCLIKFANEAVLDRIDRRAEFSIGSVHGNVATVTLPLRRVGELAGFSEVVYVEASYRLYPDLDNALPEAGVDTVQGYLIPPANDRFCDGAGVIVGATDSGIDFAHNDFQGTDGGTDTRVMYLWDQDDGDGTPPSGQGFDAGWNYGSLYTKANMDAGACPHEDDGAHGTHVMGIIAGDGSATGNGQPAGTYVGCAPAADIIMVENLGTEFWDYYNPTWWSGTGETLDGYDFIRTVANNLGRPHVINTSQGSNMGPHDGTTLFETGINADVAAGSVICLSAGNNADDRKHWEFNVPTGDSATAWVVVNTFGNSENPLIDCWFETADDFNPLVAFPTLDALYEIDYMTADAGGPMAQNTWYQFVDPDGGTGILQLQYTRAATINGDNRWLFRFQDTAVTGQWWVIGFEDRNGIPDGGVVHGWAERNYTCYFPDQTQPDTYTLGMPSCAQNAITCAAHNTKLGWTDVDDDPQTQSGTLGDTAYFSSQGPTRTDAYQKPEISAPGRYLASAWSQYDGTGTPNSMVAQDGVHVHMQGTSMSTPMVTGTVALMLQKNNNPAYNASPAQIKQSLLDTAVTDGFTGAVPNDTWGFGKMAADAAWNDYPTAAGVDEFVATLGNGKTYLEWKVSDEIDYVGFDIYRAATIFGGWVKINKEMIPADGSEYRFIDRTIPLAEGHYLYRLETVSSNGSSEMRGTTMIDFGRRNPEQMEQELLENLTKL